MNYTLLAQARKYNISFTDALISLATGLSGIPYAKRHLACAHAERKWGHRAIALLEAIPVIGVLAALIEGIVVYLFRTYFKKPPIPLKSQSVEVLSKPTIQKSKESQAAPVSEFSKFISENYDIILKSKLIEKVEDAQFFFLGEVHDYEFVSDRGIFFKTKLLKPFKRPCHEMNEKCIEKISGLTRFDPMYALEARPSMKPIFKWTRLNAEPVFLPFCVGWDIKKYVRRHLRFCYPALKEMLLRDKIRKKMCRLEQLTLKNDPRSKNEMIRIKKRIDIAVKKHLKIVKYLKTSYSSIFAERTQSMIHTIRKIQSELDNQKIDRKIIFVAGAAHLNTPIIARDTPGFLLDSLYKEIHEHKAVVLIPKCVNKLIFERGASYRLDNNPSMTLL